MTTNIFLEILSDIEEDKVKVTIETYICLFLFRIFGESLRNSLKINLVKSNTLDKNEISLSINIRDIPFELLPSKQFQNNIANLCKFPVLVSYENIVIAGLCGVCRGIIKHANNGKWLHLLGFKGACLLAPAETSIWTKFCEVDFINCTRTVLNVCHNKPIGIHKLQSYEYELPNELGKFESHLSQPIRVHNVYNVARQHAKKQTKNDDNLAAKFSELSSSDVNNLERNIIREKLPRLNKTRKSKVIFFVLQL